jgi:hypothetical protein
VFVAEHRAFAPEHVEEDAGARAAFEPESALREGELRDESRRGLTRARRLFGGAQGEEAQRQAREASESFHNRK